MDNALGGAPTQVIKWIDYDEDGRISLKDYLEGCRKIPFLMACFQASAPFPCHSCPLFPDSYPCFLLFPDIRTHYFRLFIRFPPDYLHPLFPVIYTACCCSSYRLRWLFVPLIAFIRTPYQDCHEGSCKDSVPRGNAFRRVGAGVWVWVGGGVRSQ